MKPRDALQAQKAACLARYRASAEKRRQWALRGLNGEDLDFSGEDPWFPLDVRAEIKRIKLEREQERKEFEAKQKALQAKHEQLGLL